MTNPTYTGKTWYGKRKVNPQNGKLENVSPEDWKISDGLHEPIVSKETFEEAQSILTSRAYKLPPIWVGGMSGQDGSSKAHYENHDHVLNIYLHGDCRRGPRFRILPEPQVLQDLPDDLSCLPLIALGPSDRYQDVLFLSIDRGTGQLKTQSLVRLCRPPSNCSCGGPVPPVNQRGSSGTSVSCPAIPSSS